MEKNILAVTLLSLLIISAYVPLANAHNPGPWTNPMAYELDVTASPTSMDPAFAYDSVSCEVIMNVYEKLLFFDPLWTLGPYQPPPPAPQRASTFVPQLATVVPTIDNGLIDHTGGTNPVSGLHWYSKFTFPIRTGVKFHHGAFADPDGPDGPLMGSTGILTPRDVEYSIERVLVQDREAGPAWLLYEPLLGVYGAQHPSNDLNWGAKIDGTVEVDGNNVVFYLAGQYPDLTFEQILCQTWASVMSEAWAVNEGDLNMEEVRDAVLVPPQVSLPNGVALSMPGALDKYYDENGNGIWSVGETAIKDANNNNVYDPIVGLDYVLAGSEPPINSPLTVPGLKDKYYDSNGNGIWEPNEPAVRDGGTGGIYYTNPWYDWAYIYKRWHNPSMSFLEDAIDKPDPMKDGGTGPYRMSYWTSAIGWGIRKFDDYWQGWPAPVPGSTAPLGGYLDTVSWYLVESWPTRLADLLSGHRDTVYVPRCYRDQVLGQYVWGEPIRCFYPFNLTALDAISFTSLISNAAVPEYVPVMLPLNTFGEDGVPPNIFGKHAATGNDEGLNVRKAFAHALDYDLIISCYLDEGEQPSDPIIKGLAYDDPTVPKPDYNLIKAKYYFMLAWGGLDDRAGGIHSKPVLPEDPAHIVETGGLWNGGMRFTDTWPKGNNVYMLAIQKMNIEINAMNSRFHLTDEDVDFDVLQIHMRKHKVPIFIFSWSADFNDPHDFIQPFMHSQGVMGYSQVYVDQFADEMIEQGILIPDAPYVETRTLTNATPVNINNPVCSRWTDSEGRIWHLEKIIPSDSPLQPSAWVGMDKESGPSPPQDSFRRWYHVKILLGTPSTITMELDVSRQLVYFKLQEYYVEQVPSIALIQLIGRHFEIAWCRGWYYNPLYGGSLAPGTDHTGPACPALYFYHLWKAKTHFGDCDWDGLVGGADRSVISAHWGGPPAGPGGFNPRADITGGTGATWGSGSGLVRGIPDGKVDNADLTLVSAYWDIPMGPQHPR